MLLLDFGGVATGGSIRLNEEPETVDVPTVIRSLNKKKDSKLLRYFLIMGAYKGHIDHVEAVLDKGLSIDTVDPVTGLTPLHLAVGRDDLKMTRFLVEHGARFKPDKQGRWPTTIAAACEVSQKLCDYIVEAEAAATSS